MKAIGIFNFIFEKECGASIVARNHVKLLQEYFKSNIEIIALAGSNNVSSSEYRVLNSYRGIYGKVINLLSCNTAKINNKIIKEILLIIKKENIDFVFIDDSIFGKLVKKVKEKNPNITVVCYYHDIKANLCNEWIKKHPLKIINYNVIKKNEFLTQKHCDYNLVLNYREKKMFVKYYKKEPEGFLPITLSGPTKIECSSNNYTSNILFVGAYYYPNVNGIIWFVNNVFNKLDSDFRLTIVGNGMEKIKEEFIKDDRIIVLGRVEDLSPYYFDCNMVIGPIFEGAGMKVKTAEAFSFGKIYVGTTESLEGYLDNPKVSELIDKFVFKCDDASQFLSVINKLKMCELYNANVKKVFDECYSVNSAYYILDNIVNKVV